MTTLFCQSPLQISFNQARARLFTRVPTVLCPTRMSPAGLMKPPALQFAWKTHTSPTKHFPVATVNRILKDVLTAHLQEAEYDPEFCRQMTKTISEVIKARVKELMIPRYKLIVTVYIGQQDGQSILIGSRCLWNPKSDTVSSYTFRNSTLFALANVYAVYFE
ncbi:tctex1 domain-containing protein 1 isoform X3 [Peromyscus leucopus]|uniref:tctex1 domain-containing protein 1 isoform X3 n=1 Tax=Peromyscus leucopus TaxID=10041 RepID=UPI0018852064|nr:tctex1 domain-containing protein 1 isoform X3 [Peromyscus leucopus]